MSKVVKRGYAENDEKEFITQIDKLRDAGRDLHYLMNRGYPSKNASIFVGNHYLLSERQRLALVRSIATDQAVASRKAKEKARLEPGCEVSIDCFNTVISLEIAFSDSTLLLCMDGTIRDLAGLRGTYRLIDKTRPAIQSIRKLLETENVKTAHFLIDAPVSNSGRLKAQIAELFSGSSVETEFAVIRDVDRSLYGRDNVITSDAVILDHCRSWFNLVRRAIELEIGDYPFVEIQGDPVC
ncbi:MAG: DUF434 domain-containing protein [Eubacterium sp.]|nr:DUF434 domain-containing protein [Eubacterium sp.]